MRALGNISNRIKNLEMRGYIMSGGTDIEEIFAENVFTVGKMKEYLPKETFDEVMTIREQGGELPLKTADIEAGEDS